MHFWKMFFVYLGVEVLCSVQSAPYFGDDEDYSNPESRRRHMRKKKRPCARSQSDDYRTWQFSYVNANYNYYCGDGGGSNASPHITSADENQNGNNKPGHRPLSNFINSKPLHQSPIDAGLPNRPSGGNKPVLGLLQGITNGLQNQVQGIADGLQSQDEPDHNKPSGGNKPVLGLLQGFTNGIFGGLFNGGLVNNFFGNRPKPPAGNDEIPVHEEQDDVVPDGTEKWSPGQYIVGYNPLTGQYVQDVTNFNPKRVFRQVNRQVDRFLRPLYNIF